MTNDPKDRHVLAAAVKPGANVIVTYNQQLAVLRPAAPSFVEGIWQHLAPILSFQPLDFGCVARDPLRHFLMPRMSFLGTDTIGMCRFSRSVTTLPSGHP